MGVIPLLMGNSTEETIIMIMAEKILLLLVFILSILLAVQQMQEVEYDSARWGNQNSQFLLQGNDSAKSLLSKFLYFNLPEILLIQMVISVKKLV